MFKNLWDRILILFGKKKTYDDKLVEHVSKDTLNYEDTRNINFSAIFANKLANYTVSDANIDLIGDDKRTELLRDSLVRLKKKLKKVVARELGTGGVVVIPYVARNKIYFNILSQSRLLINRTLGDDIIDCTILADEKVIGTEHYKRWADYVLDGNTLTIRYRATSDHSDYVDMKLIPEWENIQEEIRITNVEKMPFMFIKSPIDNRRESDTYGVPITYGCEKQVNEIKVTLQQIIREYDLKEAFIGADSTMFTGNGGLTENGLYKKINSGEDSFWEVFSPEIRDSSLYNKLMQQCALLEKQIGTSRGILTERESNNATATEIKASQKDTFDLIDDIRTTLDDGLEDYIYACDILANYYNLVPFGKYELKTDWDYSMIEDTQTTFSQLIQGVNNGVISKAELRQFIKSEETLEEAEEAIRKIKEEEPTTKDLLGE